MNCSDNNQMAPDYFSEYEVNKILEESSKINEESNLLCSLLWVTGARISEIMLVSVSNIDFTNGSIKLQTLRRKIMKYRLLPLSEDILRLAKKYIYDKCLGCNDRLFSFTQRTAFNYFKKACTLAGISDKRTHPSSFRHSYAIKYINDGVKLININERLGNSDIKKTVNLYIDSKRKNYIDMEKAQ